MMTDPTIIQLNIDHFQRLLATRLDEKTRQTVETLLAEAQAELGAAAPQKSSDYLGPA